MKLKEGEKKFSRGWEYRELYFQLEESFEQLNFLGGKNEDYKSNTLQEPKREETNNRHI